MRRRVLGVCAVAVVVLFANGCSVWHELWTDTGSEPSTARERRIKRIERKLDENNRLRWGL